MSGFRRSRQRRFQVWLQQRTGRWLNPQWLQRVTLSVRRGMARWHVLLLRLIAPKWLHRAFASLQNRIRRAESSIARKRDRVGQTVARSPVAEGAKKLARSGHVLESRFTKFVVEAVKFVGTLLSGLVPSPLRRLLGQIIWQCRQAVSLVLGFFGRWFRTRHYWHLLGGLPAFLLALPLAYCMIRMPFYTADYKVKHYRRAAEEAMMEKDFTTADLYYRKLYQLGATSDAVDYQSAINCIESGDIAEGIERLKQLAPEDQPGFAPAHLWIAHWYLNGKSSLDQAVAASLAEKHLGFVLDREPGNVEARALRARHLQITGRWDDAASELQEVVRQLPERGLNLAEIYARQGRWDAARQEVDKVLKIFADKVENQTELNAYEYSTWHSAYRILGQLEEAEAVLKEGCQKFPQDQQLRDQLQSLLINHAIGKLQNREGDPQEIVDRLLLAAQIKPDDPDPLIRLSEMAVEPGPFGRYAMQVLKQRLDSGQAPPQLYAIFGPLIGLEDDLPTAIRYLRKAVELDPNDSFSLNNLAFCLISQGDGSDPEVLELVNRALAIEPDQAMYRETRGQALLLLGRYQEAIDDLTFALNGMGDDPKIHAALATAYEQLGQAEQASIHRGHTQ